MIHITYVKNGYIILGGIELPGIPNSIHVDKYELQRKNEFHATLVGARVQTYISDDENGKKLLKEAFDEFVRSHDLTQYKIINEFRLVTREDRVTIIVMINIENIEKLYDFLNEKFGINLPIQPGHITLYSLNPEVGISLNSVEQLEGDSRIVALPELAVKLGF